MNSIGIEFVAIEAGSFMMGNERYYDDQKPVHEVRISKAFYMGKYPVTQSQWEAVMEGNPSHFNGPDLPVESVSWNEVQFFIKKLNEMEDTNEYRLPTEAEWEYACRADTETEYYFGDDENQLGLYAWYYDNSDRKTHPVGQKLPNTWGLYDMHGNVWEWVQDWYDYYKNGYSTDPEGPDSGSGRVLRGGCWSNIAGNLRSADRGPNSPDSSNYGIGFRLARDL